MNAPLPDLRPVRDVPGFPDVDPRFALSRAGYPWSCAGTGGPGKVREWHRIEVRHTRKRGAVVAVKMGGRWVMHSLLALYEATWPTLRPPMWMYPDPGQGEPKRRDRRRLHLAENGRPACGAGLHVADDEDAVTCRRCRSILRRRTRPAKSKPTRREAGYVRASESTRVHFRVDARPACGERSLDARISSLPERTTCLRCRGTEAWEMVSGGAP